MGVKDLWKILEPVKEPVGTGDLKSLTLAVDLSVWVCEAEGVHEMRGRVTKPYLRNLFFRVFNLRQLGVGLIFVVDGEAPELKLEEMARRNQARFGVRGRGRGYPPSKKVGRSHFKALLRECCELLELMGIPFIQSQGEAEALCALLNKHKIVDGCITNDGDAFLYGATTVFRNFTIDRKAQDNQIDKYTMHSIESTLNLDRDKLIALGLLLGCDFVPKGVPGVGQCRAVKMMEDLPNGNVLERMCLWKSDRFVSASPIEEQIRQKSFILPDFPSHKVIAEFTKVKDNVPKRLPTETRPKLFSLQRFLVSKLDWQDDYALEKVLPLVTMYDMRQICTQPVYKDSNKCLRPYNIVKARVKQFVHMYEVLWYKVDGDNIGENEYYVTIEEQEIFTRCFPKLVQDFEASRTKPKGRKVTKKAQDAEKENFDPSQVSPSKEIEHNLDTTCNKLASLSLKNNTTSFPTVIKPRDKNDIDTTCSLSLRHRLENKSRLKDVKGSLELNSKPTSHTKAHECMRKVKSTQALIETSNVPQTHKSLKSKDVKPKKPPFFLDDSIEDLLFDVNDKTRLHPAVKETVDLTFSDTISFCVKRTRKKVSTNVSVVKQNCTETSKSNYADTKNSISELKCAVKSRESVAKLNEMELIKNNPVLAKKIGFDTDSHNTSYALSVQTAITQLTGRVPDLHTDKSKNNKITVTSSNDEMTSSDSDDEEMLPLSQRLLLRASQTCDMRDRREKFPSESDIKLKTTSPNEGGAKLKTISRNMEDQNDVACKSENRSNERYNDSSSDSDLEITEVHSAKDFSLSDSDFECCSKTKKQTEDSVFGSPGTENKKMREKNQTDQVCIPNKETGSNGRESPPLAESFNQSVLVVQYPVNGPQETDSNDRESPPLGESFNQPVLVIQSPVNEPQETDSNDRESPPLAESFNQSVLVIQSPVNGPQSQLELGSNRSSCTTPETGGVIVITPQRVSLGSREEVERSRNVCETSARSDGGNFSLGITMAYNSTVASPPSDLESYITPGTSDGESTQNSYYSFSNSSFSPRSTVKDRMLSFTEKQESECKMRRSMECPRGNNTPEMTSIECPTGLATPDRTDMITTDYDSAIGSPVLGYNSSGLSYKSVADSDSEESSRPKLPSVTITESSPKNKSNTVQSNLAEHECEVRTPLHCVDTVYKSTNQLAVKPSRDLCFLNDYSPIITCNAAFGIGHAGNRLKTITPVVRKNKLSLRNKNRDVITKLTSYQEFKPNADFKGDKNIPDTCKNTTVIREKQKRVQFDDVIDISNTDDVTANSAQTRDDGLSFIEQDTVIMRRSFEKTFNNDDTVTILLDDENVLDEL